MFCSACFCCYCCLFICCSFLFVFLQSESLFVTWESYINHWCFFLYFTGNSPTADGCLALIINAISDESSQINSKHYSEQFYDYDSAEFVEGKPLYKLWTASDPFSCFAQSSPRCKFLLAESKRIGFSYDFLLVT